MKQENREIFETKGTLTEALEILNEVVNGREDAATAAVTAMAAGVPLWDVVFQQCPATALGYELLEGWNKIGSLDHISVYPGNTYFSYKALPGGLGTKNAPVTWNVSLGTLLARHRGLTSQDDSEPNRGVTRIVVEAIQVAMEALQNLPVNMVGPEAAELSHQAMNLAARAKKSLP